MLKTLLWVVSKDYRFLNEAINILERQHNGLKLVDKIIGKNSALVDAEDYDVIFVIGAKQIGMNQIVQVARQIKLPEEKLLGDWIACIPGFTLEKYRRLQRSRLSIISKNCFGGIISHQLGLPFRSPFVNLSVRNEQECIRLFQNLRSYMEKDLTFKGTNFEPNLKFDYPIFTFGDVDLHMNHYRNFDEALAKWNTRKQKINWYNLFITAFTANEKILEQFDALPFGKKVCFVPFKSDLDSAWYINPEINPGLEFWDTVNRFGMDNSFYYDVFDMLLYGKKTPLIEM